jgi:hypothetical protein
LFRKLVASETRVLVRSIEGDFICAEEGRLFRFMFSFDFYLDLDLLAAFLMVMDLSDSMNDFCLA